MRVKISEFKARLSAYLEAVRRGETVIVLDRKTPVVQLVPLPEAADEFRVVPASRDAL